MGTNPWRRQPVSGPVVTDVPTTPTIRRAQEPHGLADRTSPEVLAARRLVDDHDRLSDLPIASPNPRPSRSGTRSAK